MLRFGASMVLKEATTRSKFELIFLHEAGKLARKPRNFAAGKPRGQGSRVEVPVLPLISTCVLF